MAEGQIGNKNTAFQRIVECSPLGMHLYELQRDDRLVFIGANPAADRILGVNNAQFIGKTIEEAFPQLAETEVPQRYREAALTGKTWSTEQISYEEGEIAGAFQVVAFQTEERRMAVQFMDITPRKRLESQLRSFELAVGSSTDAIGMSTLAGKHFYQNRAFDKLFGEIGEDPPKTLYVDEAVGRDVFASIMAGNRWEGEVKMYSATREIRDIALRAYASRDDSGEIGLLVGVHTDITEQKRFMEAAEKNHRLEALGLLAGGIAHDFNNVLGAIFGHVNLEMIGQTEDQAAKGHLSKVLLAMDRATALTGQLLTFSKVAHRSKKSRILFPFVEETVRFALSGANASCRFAVDDHLWMCDFDKNQLAQVIENITINALQSMPTGGTFQVTAMNVEVGGRAEPSPQERHISLTFRDTGMGIPESILQRIFDPFFSTKAQGHGLGLSTSHSIVKRHGGDIHVSSIPGQGTTFAVLLPAATSSPSPSSPQGPSEKFTGTGRILVMDDEPMIRQVLKGMLEAIGYEVVVSRDGTEAIEVYQDHLEKGEEFLAIFLDLTVPGGLGGQEAVSLLRQKGARMPIFVISGYASAPILSQPHGSGFTDSLSKPFRLNQLTKLLAKHL